jgi:hypothetical protein
VHSQILRPNFGSLAALAIVLVTAALLALALLTGYRPAVIVTSPAATPAIQTVIPTAPTVDANPDRNLPVCRQHGGPAC